MNHVIHRLRPIVAPLVIIAIITQLFPALASPLTVQAQATIYNPADNIYLDFYDNAATPASECHPNYPTFGRCRSGELFNTGFTQVLPGSNPADLSKLALEPGLPTDSAKNGSLKITSTRGDAYQNAALLQDNALVLPFNSTNQRFSIGVRLLAPFNVASNYQAGGLVIGLDTNRYAKLVYGYAGSKRLQFLIEDPAVGGANTIDVRNLTLSGANPAPTTSLDLFFSADPVTKKLTALYRVDSDDPDAVQELSVANWYNHYFTQPIYGGLITTSNGTNTPFTFNFDWFKLGEFVAPGAAGTNVSFSVPSKIISTPNGGMVNPTTLTFGPDGRLYVGTYSGRVYSYALDLNGQPTDVRTYLQIYNRPNATCPTDGGNAPPVGLVCASDPSVVGRQLLGLEFSPTSTANSPELYITHSDPRFTQASGAASKKIDTNSGTISRLRFDSSGTVIADEDLVSGLPRSREYHSIDGLDFGPDGWLYVGIGSNTNMGDDDNNFFSYLPEYYFSSSVVRLKPDAPGFTPIDVRSVDEPADMLAYAGMFELFATGFRNPYDLTWHSNGKLYVNTNGSNNGLGGTPNDGSCTGYPKTVTVVETDRLDAIEAGKYYGHPNPARSECVWGAGGYGTPAVSPLPNYVPAAYSYGGSRSVNGIAEYTAGTFSNQLKGNLIVAAYAGTKSVRRLVLNSAGTQVLLDQPIDQTLASPLDVTVDSVGVIYIADLGNQKNPGSSPGGIYRMVPNDSGTTPALACKNAGLDAARGYHVDPARGDSDSDGYLDQDELDNGTAVCNASSKPVDFDGAASEHLSFKLSDLYDTDIDNDGVANNLDQLQFDAANGAAPLPIRLPFENETRGIFKTGFNGVLLRGDAVATMGGNSGRGFGLYQPTSRLQANGVSGALGMFGTSGSSRGLANNQDNALQIGFDATQPFSITTETSSPFDGLTSQPFGIEEGGLFFGLDADNSVKLQLRRTTAQALTFVLTSEQGGQPTDILGPQLALPFTGTIRLALIAYPIEGYLSARYSIRPPSLTAAYGPWATLATVNVDSVPTLSSLFRAPTCSTTANGCVATAGLHVSVADAALGFTDLFIEPFPAAKPGNSTSALSASRPSPTTGPVSLSWQTNGQARISGFNIYRASSNNRNAASKITNLPIASSGDPLEAQSYGYSDSSAPINPVYYWLEPQLTSGLAAPALTTQLNAKANQTIDFDELSNKTFGDASFSLSASSSSGLAVSYSASGSCSISGSSVTISGAGSCTIAATQAGNASYNAAQLVGQSFSIAKASATVSVPNLVVIYSGEAQAVVPSTSPAGLGLNVIYEGIETTTYGPSSTPPTDVGLYQVSASVNSANYVGQANGTLTISPAQATVELVSSSVNYTGQPHGATATSTPAGLTINLSYADSGGALISGEPVAAGVYTVTAVINAPNYVGQASGTVTISKAEATVSINDASFIFDGGQKIIAPTISPSGMSLSVIYTGFGSTSYGPTTTPPSSVGIYKVTATVNDPNYQGEQSALLTISSGEVVITISGLSATFGSAEQPVGVMVTPAVQGYNVSYSGIDGTRYGPSSTPPSEAGSYAVVVTVIDPNREGVAAETLIIAPTSATLALADLSATYSGSPHAASASTTPNGLLVELSYSGIEGTSYGPSSAPPTNAGNYRVEANIAERNYVSVVSETLVIAKAPAPIELSNLSASYSGGQHVASARSMPAELLIDIIYSGIEGTSYGPSAVAPTNAGSYRVEATINAANYTGGTSATLVIARAGQTISFADLDNKLLSAGPFSLSATASSRLAVSYSASGPCAMNGNSVTISGAGSCTISASQAGDSNYLPAGPVERSFAITDDIRIEEILYYRIYIPMVER